MFTSLHSTIEMSYSAESASSSLLLKGCIGANASEFYLLIKFNKGESRSFNLTFMPLNSLSLSDAFSYAGYISLD